MSSSNKSHYFPSKKKKKIKHWPKAEKGEKKDAPRLLLVAVGGPSWEARQPSIRRALAAPRVTVPSVEHGGQLWAARGCLCDASVLVCRVCAKGTGVGTCVLVVCLGPARYVFTNGGISLKACFLLNCDLQGTGGNGGRKRGVENRLLWMLLRL